MTVRVIPADCRMALPPLGPFDMLLADPPYGDTSLEWDRRCEGWIDAAAAMLKPTGSMWVFGSMRFFQDMGARFQAAGLRLAQDIVWEKHNGSGFHADRFKRVHEHACQYYRDGTPWAGIFNEVQVTADATARAVRRKKRPAHTGHIDASHYISHDGGPRIMRSVIFMASMHGRAIHPTEKPSDLVEILIRTSCPPGGVVADLFAGSGSAGEAAMRAGRRYVGCEIDASMAQLANDRLAAILPLATVDGELTKGTLP
jgi:site-specific DNA-methyltransferase (adenine-specific)